MKEYVYILKRHPWNNIWGGYLEASVIVGVYLNRKEPVKIAKEKNKRSDYKWVVTRKEVK